MPSTKIGSIDAKMKHTSALKYMDMLRRDEKKGRIYDLEMEYEEASDKIKNSRYTPHARVKASWKVC